VQTEFISAVLLPAILAFIMFSLGLGLTAAEFRAVILQPRALLVGVLCHFVLLPVICFSMVKVFGLSGYFAVGFMILAACPTGTTSNLLTYLAKGDVALAISFTAIASVLTIVTLPLIVSWSIKYFIGNSQAVNVPILTLVANVFLLMGLPVGLGMLVRRRYARIALRYEPYATRASTLLFVLILGAAIVRNWAILRDNAMILAPMALTLNVLMLLVGVVMAWSVRLLPRQSVTLGIESAMQNATLALVIASSVLRQEQMAVPGAVYGVMMYVGGLAFAFAARRVLSKPLAVSGVPSNKSDYSAKPDV
jgi:bile acid:Na+ symporter, BASS family